ncbi:hypothetical protein [Candidatus Uabimicrobium sp. HlEnr_7]|uniref:hypothetical protein n=1 Tax=Candidatus Uabimicrobium helgolandensis TaxID=3095367 RepID=UPI003558DFCB
MSKQKSKGSKFSFYLEAMGCFVFFLLLLVGFLFLAKKMYKIYTATSIEKESGDIEENIKPQEDTKEENKQQRSKNSHLSDAFIDLIKKAKTKERVYALLDNASQLPLTKEEKEWINSFGEIRLKELQK